LLLAGAFRATTTDAINMQYLFLLTFNATIKENIQHLLNQEESFKVLSELRDNEYIPVPEIIDPFFAKTSQNARFLVSENERFGLVFVKTGSINSGTGIDRVKKVFFCKLTL
jgi:hypothetical protein